MDEKCRDLILHKRMRRIGDEHSCTIDDVNTVLDHRPIEMNRDQYLKRALALKLLQLDELEEAFRDKALSDRDVASGVLLVKVAERRATCSAPIPRLAIRLRSSSTHRRIVKPRPTASKKR